MTIQSHHKKMTQKVMRDKKIEIVKLGTKKPNFKIRELKFHF
jgi:hypothetical protein